LAQLRGEDFSQLHIVGGGCQNTLLNQLCADACGIRVIAGPVEASTLGSLLASVSISAMASPVLLPGEASPRISIDGNPL
ncbi:FGGY-family carbohydrate kinase, partial [Acinetobacter variabilis]